VAGRIELDRDALVEALRHLEVIVPSLDRIGSSAAEMTDEEYRRVISDFVRNWHVGRRLAEVRRALSQAFEDDELERLFGEVETWAPNHPKPGP